MDQALISDDVRRFVLINVPSVPYLEAMLLLRASGGEAWQADVLARRLYLSEKAAAGLLAQLHDAGILELRDAHTLSYGYRPSSDGLRQIIDAVAQAYAANLVGVTHLIHSKTDRKAQRLADAFLWTKDT